MLRKRTEERSVHAYADSPATAGVWNKLIKPPEAKIAMSLSRAEYLDSIVPGQAASAMSCHGVPVFLASMSTCHPIRVHLAMQNSL